MLAATECYNIFQKSIDAYHLRDDVDAPLQNPYPSGSVQAILYHKNWIDTVQWHLEDIIRKPDIDPVQGIALKRRIDHSNQERTDMVEKLDDYFLEEFKDVTYQPDARINSETPAWLLDRMSILLLKIFHMKEQTQRKDATEAHRAKCVEKLTVLQEQRQDMQLAYEELVLDIAAGRRKFKVYRQMKMYNDASLNPMLYNPSAK